MSSASISATATLSSRSGVGGFYASRWRIFLLGFLLAILTIAAYYPAHNHPYVNIDDQGYVENNPHVNKGLSWGVVRWAFTTSYQSNWHPLTWLVHATDCEMFQVNPAGHHDTNVLLHVVSVVLLFWVLYRATGYPGRSFAVAALFALHPINVESVAWIAELKTMLSMVFFLLALGAYRWYALAPRATRYVLVAILFVLGLMAKPQVITLPAVFLLWDYWPLRRMFASDPEAVSGTATQAVAPPRTFLQLVEEKVPFGVLVLIDSLITMKAQRVGRPSGWTYTFWNRSGNAIVSYVRYLGKAFWPSRLGLMYPHPGSSLSGWHVLGAFLVLVAITAVVAANWRRRYLVVGWLWFLGTMVPMVGLVQVGRQALADRYAYLPFVGIFIMVCWSVAEWAGRRHFSTAALAGATVLLLLALFAVTHRQLGYWQDSASIWKHTLEVTGPNNFEAEAQVGNSLLDEGHQLEALQHFYHVLAAKPDDAVSNLGVAVYEHQNGQLAESIKHYRKWLAQAENNDSKRPQVLINMGFVYKKLGDAQHSQECFEAAAKVPLQ